MTRASKFTTLLALAVVALGASLASAQDDRPVALRYQWNPGETVMYRLAITGEAETQGATVLRVNAAQDLS